MAKISLVSTPNNGENFFFKEFPGGWNPGQLKKLVEGEYGFTEQEPKKKDPIEQWVDEWYEKNRDSL